MILKRFADRIDPPNGCVEPAVMVGCVRRTYCPNRGSLFLPLLHLASRGFSRRPSSMPHRLASAPLSERSAAVLAEAMRRVDTAIPGVVDLDALRQALETEQAKGPRSLVALMKVGRRRALDRMARAARKAEAQC